MWPTPSWTVNTTSTPCTGAVINSHKLCALSVPCGRVAATCNTGGNTGAIAVEAFGRTLAGTSTKVLISSMNAASQAVAANFGAAPGYSTGNAAGDTAYPFRLHTDTGGRIRLRANNATGATAYLDTDGWVFRR